MSSSAPREQWSSRTGFILAAVGSAVGLGNMWRFSYLAAENGGAAFVVLYLLLTVLVGLPVMLAELAVGRGSRKSPVAALTHFGGTRWRPLGWLFVASGFLILSYYSVIAGWTVRYALSGFAGFAGDAGAFFGEVATGVDAIAWHVAFMSLTVLIVAGGIKGGIERLTLVLMPALFGLVLLLAIYAATLEGGGEGYRYYLSTDFSRIWDRQVLSQAAGQAFFSLSLGMGAILTFASYLDRHHHLPNESALIGLSDFSVALVAGLVVFPVIFAFGMEAMMSGSTVGALFITLPTAFNAMGTAGTVVGVLFFAALVVGALTSAVSLLEVVVSSAIDIFHWPRKRAALLAGGLIAVLGIPAALDTNLLGLMDQLAGNVFLVLGGLTLAIFVGWVMDDPIAAVSEGAEGVAWFGVWRWLLRYLVPVLLAFVLVASVQGTIEAVRGLTG